ncbi:hypothetical protein C8J57DRAFT_1251457 [Mycena rebaudengoi]|nr:hypothetical protein C8J57DRAFT_1251457 [Mycena rebaudengoi]
MEIRENDKRLCLHRIDVVIIAAVITILITVTTPSARWWAPPRALVWRRAHWVSHTTDPRDSVHTGQTAHHILRRGDVWRGAQVHAKNLVILRLLLKAGRRWAGHLMGDGIDRGGGDAHMGRRTAMMDSDQGGIFSDVCDHFPPSRHQSRITSEAQFEKGRSDSEVFLTRF